MAITKQLRHNFQGNLTGNHVRFLLDHYRREWEVLEYELAKHERAERIKHGALRAGELALAALLVGGIVTVAMVAPNVGVVFRGLQKPRRFFREDNLPKKIRELSANAYVHYQKMKGGEYRVAITKKGERIAKKFALRNFKLHWEKEWDGAWRLIFFDVAKKHSTARDALREKLKHIGAVALQKSVFIYPYPCREDIFFWASIFNVPDSVYCVETRNVFSVSGDMKRSLCKHFNIRPHQRSAPRAYTRGISPFGHSERETPHRMSGHRPFIPRANARGILVRG